MGGTPSFSPSGASVCAGRPGPVAGGQAQILAILVLADCVPDATQGDPGILVDGGPHVGGDRLLLAGILLHDDHHAFALGLRLRSHLLVLSQPIIAKGAVSLQIMSSMLYVYLCLLIRKLEKFPRPSIAAGQTWWQFLSLQQPETEREASFSFYSPPPVFKLGFQDPLPVNSTLCSRQTAVIVQDLRLLDMLSSLPEHSVFLTNSYLFFKTHL